VANLPGPVANNAVAPGKGNQSVSVRVWFDDRVRVRFDDRSVSVRGRLDNRSVSVTEN